VKQAANADAEGAGYESLGPASPRWFGPAHSGPWWYACAVAGRISGANKTRGAAIKSQLNTEIAACDKIIKNKKNKNKNHKNTNTPTTTTMPAVV
jgi:hypothetical protein